ncbi:MAG TPA: sigma-70 family RNA polymerase sigma factor [Planctomycetota bacterium]|nr:sigma-70 family RNA polymerase sigma factor [Planctomycetota bacterium]
MPSATLVELMPGHASSADSQRWVMECVAVYEQPLTSYALKLTGELESARDAVQETFLRLCKEERSAIEGHIAEWLFRVCRTRALDGRRKEKRMAVLTETISRAPVEETKLPPDAIQQKEDTSRMLKHLSSLPPNQQEVLRLKFQHGMSYREISSITSLSVTNVGFLIHTGLKTLRARLTE